MKEKKSSGQERSKNSRKWKHKAKMKRKLRIKPKSIKTTNNEPKITKVTMRKRHLPLISVVIPIEIRIQINHASTSTPVLTASHARTRNPDAISLFMASSPAT
jgi:hypothetical protein